jgi:transcription antitermination factor NusG
MASSMMMMIDGANLSRGAEPRPCWYAAYTYGNHEKKAAAEIARRGVESFLPVYRTVRRWSDRRVELEMPLFPGYVFVRLALQDRLKVLQVSGVSRLVGFGTLRAGLNGQLRAEPHPFLAVGRRVRVKVGPLQGLEGFVVRRKSGTRLIITLDLIQRSVAVEMEAEDLERA